MPQHSEGNKHPYKKLYKKRAQSVFHPSKSTFAGTLLAPRATFSSGRPLRIFLERATKRALFAGAGSRPAQGDAGAHCRGQAGDRLRTVSRQLVDSMLSPFMSSLLAACYRFPTDGGRITRHVKSWRAKCRALDLKALCIPVRSYDRKAHDLGWVDGNERLKTDMYVRMVTDKDRYILAPSGSTGTHPLRSGSRSVERRR